MNSHEYQAALRWLTAEEKRELDIALGLLSPVWSPDPRNRPQCAAYTSVADVIGFGGGAGGGKTDLAIGKALTQHKVAAIFRREGTELTAIVDRVTALIGNRDGYNGQEKIWRNPVPGVQLEFGSCPNLGDERKHQGRPKDLLVLDEAANFLEQQVRFLMGWVRSVDPKQHCQVLMPFNPPTSAEGQWIIQFFAPWLDDTHPCPAAPGELRWFAMIDGKEREVADGRHFVVVDGQMVYDFNPAEFRLDKIVRPQSRTFIPSRVGDNPYLAGTNYMATLQALPEPLRSQMLYGDFKAGMKDDPWQVCPTAWVEAAMARWKPREIKTPMDSMGADVARGGDDNTILSRRHENWYDTLLAYLGKETPDGPIVAGLVVANARDRAVIHIDVIGVGASPYDFLRKAEQQVVGVNVSETAHGTDISGLLTFSNQRSEMWWGMREDLDPANNRGIALPPDSRLKADLCAPKWWPEGKKVFVEDREAIIKRIGRSPDYASAVLLARLNTPKISSFNRTTAVDAQRGHDPYSILGGAHGGGGLPEHDPYANLP